MDNDVIERLARAAIEARAAALADNAATPFAASISNSELGRISVRAALSALIPPTPGMVEAGAIQHGLWTDSVRRAEPIRQNVRAIFTAAIQHVLSEEG